MDLEDIEFLKFVSAAAENELDYLLIGGLALAMHGIARYTQDADVWVKPVNENKEKFINTLVSLGYEDEDTSNIRGLNFEEAQILKLEGPIDILTSVHFRFEFDACRARAREFVTSTGHKIYFVHINDLRELKVLARRPKDLLDVVMIDELLEEISKRPNAEQG
jgi:hypothetical protein